LAIGLSLLLPSWLKIRDETQNLRLMSDSAPSSGPTTASAPTRQKYRTLPDQQLTTMPPGVPYIIGNEAAERFSFYGMRAVLTVFMTKYLMDRSGHLAVMGDDEAGAWSHMFVSAVYFLPILGALLSDGVVGKFRTIFYLSIVYCFGHFSLALDDTRLGLFLGLLLISFGAGGIKPCVSANVGDQFGQGNKHLLPRVFSWFYFSINVGSFVSIWVCPILLDDPRFGPHYAFGLPGVFMVIATVVFWLGRKKFVHVRPGGLGFIREAVSREGRSAIGQLFLIYLFVAIFWALWDQSAGIEWTLQAEHLNLNFLGLKLLAAQVSDANAILILIFIPLFSYGVYPLIDRIFPLTPLRKIGIGLFVMAIAFAIVWWLQVRIDAGQTPNVGWQLLAYVFLTASETMVSITGLEFSYTQAPPKMKSAIMAVWLLVVSLGNLFTAFMHSLVPTLKPLGLNLENAGWFQFFTLLMVGAAIIYVFVARWYRGKTYIQGEEPAELATAETLSS
jgi:proton-dependent oligopeptide transporter, POT family